MRFTHAFWVWLLAFASIFVASTVWAATYTPPPIKGHITDMAGKLSASEVDALDTKLSEYKKCSTNHVAVFLPASLEGNTIEDVAYETFNTWKIGEGKKDNGVLLVIAPAERKNFIATGKGVGGDLPDVAAFHILRDKVSPRLKEDKYLQAVDDGTTAIGAALGGCAMKPLAIAGSQPEPASKPPGSRPTSPPRKPVDLHIGARIAMTATVFVLMLAIMIGLRSQPFFILFLSAFVAIIFGGITFSLEKSEPLEPPWGYDFESLIAVFVLSVVILGMVVAIVWARRKQMGTGVFGYGGDGYSSDGSSVGSSSDSSFSSSLSSFTSSSSSSSSSDNSYSGGGGSTGGGGAGDSW